MGVVEVAWEWVSRSLPPPSAVVPTRASGLHYTRAEAAGSEGLDFRICPPPPPQKQNADQRFGHYVGLPLGRPQPRAQTSRRYYPLRPRPLPFIPPPTRSGVPHPPPPRRLLCALVGGKTPQVDIPGPTSRRWGEAPHRRCGTSAWTPVPNGEGSCLPPCGLDTEK